MPYYDYIMIHRPTLAGVFGQTCTIGYCRNVYEAQPHNPYRRQSAYKIPLYKTLFCLMTHFFYKKHIQSNSKITFLTFIVIGSCTMLYKAVIWNWKTTEVRGFIGQTAGRFACLRAAKKYIVGDHGMLCMYAGITFFESRQCIFLMGFA